jgi:hypothetical protein
MYVGDPRFCRGNVGDLSFLYICLVGYSLLAIRLLMSPIYDFRWMSGFVPPGADPPSPLTLCVAKAGRNNLNEEFTRLLPTGIGERYGKTKSNLGHAALLCRCELPL